MGKASNLSEFDKSEVVMARRVETSVSETACLVGCLHVVAVNTYRKWCTDGETINLRPAVSHPRELIPEERGDCYALIIVTEELKQPKSLTATTVATQTVFLNHTVPRVRLRMCYAAGNLNTSCVHSTSSIAAPAMRPWTSDTVNMAKRKTVAWSNKSHFLVHHIDGRVRVRRFPTKTLTHECIVVKILAYGGYIIVWMIFLSNALVPISP